jgi:hypothetical protein
MLSPFSLSRVLVLRYGDEAPADEDHRAARQHRVDDGSHHEKAGNRDLDAAQLKR